MGFISLLKKIPIDLGQGEERTDSKAKLIAFSFVGIGAEKNALEIGCGKGYWSEKLKALGYNVTSLDINKTYEHARIVNVEHGLPFSDHTFNLVWASEVLEHLADPDFAAREMRRVLKPGGRLILTTPNSHFWLYPLFQIFGYTPADLQNKGHKQFFHAREIAKLFPKAKIYGFFPYAILKFRLKNFWLISLLSPNFIIIE